jgi:hypothetical protein
MLQGVLSKKLMTDDTCTGHANTRAMCTRLLVRLEWLHSARHRCMIALSTAHTGTAAILCAVRDKLARSSVCTACATRSTRCCGTHHTQHYMKMCATGVTAYCCCSPAKISNHLPHTRVHTRATLKRLNKLSLACATHHFKVQLWHSAAHYHPPREATVSYSSMQCLSCPSVNKAASQCAVWHIVQFKIQWQPCIAAHWHVVYASCCLTPPLCAIIE